MPGFLSHYIAGQAALQLVRENVRNIILGSDKNNGMSGEKLYNLGTQGPDIFFYYMPGHLRKRSRGLGTEMHQGNIGKFFLHMANITRNAPASQKDTIFAYTAGFIMHYALDAQAHPYVYARTHLDNVPKIKNSTVHRKFETAIDVALLKLVSGKKPADYGQWELIRANPSQMLIAADATRIAVKNVYKRILPLGVVYRALQCTVWLTRLLQSRKGRRKRWMELVENLTIRENLYSALIHDQQLSKAAEKEDCLNTKKAPWNAPWAEANEFSSDSFIERYHLAVQEGAQMLDSLYSFAYEDLDIENLKKVIGCRSLKTGKHSAPKPWKLL